MAANLIQRIKHHILKWDNSIDASLNINDHSFIWNIIMRPDFPWMISFPRTGSHWLRMIMELYFQKPSLVEVYYYKEAKEFTCFHQHDINLTIGGCTNVLYLYRDPVDTIYSLMCYDRSDLKSETIVRNQASLYGRHLSKWLLDENFTKKKTVITYEDLKEDMNGTFKKVCNHFNAPFDRDKLDKVLIQISKEELKKKSKHDPQVVNLSAEYKNNREVFKERFSSVILDTTLSQNEKLRSYIRVK